MLLSNFLTLKFTFSFCHLGPKDLVEIMFNDIELVQEEAMFNNGLCVSNVAETLLLLFECEWTDATLTFDFEWIDATLKFIFDCK